MCGCARLSHCGPLRRWHSAEIFRRKVCARRAAIQSLFGAYFACLRLRPLLLSLIRPIFGQVWSFNRLRQASAANAEGATRMRRRQECGNASPFQPPGRDMSRGGDRPTARHFEWFHTSNTMLHSIVAKRDNRNGCLPLRRLKERRISRQLRLQWRPKLSTLQ